MSGSAIMDALSIAADAWAEGRADDWEAILAEIADDAWAFECWPKPKDQPYPVAGGLLSTLDAILKRAYPRQGERAANHMLLNPESYARLDAQLCARRSGKSFTGLRYMRFRRDWDSDE